jgi:hypothetical protein
MSFGSSKNGDPKPGFISGLAEVVVSYSYNFENVSIASILRLI